MIETKLIGIFGGSQCTDQEYELGMEVGRLIARRGGVVVCGGLSGIMEAVCKGAYEEEGLTVGILPDDDIYSANPYVKIPIATGMGIGRNIIIVRTAQVCIAIDGRYGTLSEVAYALQLRKTVINLKFSFPIPGLLVASSAQEAVDLAFQAV